MLSGPASVVRAGGSNAAPAAPAGESSVQNLAALIRRRKKPTLAENVVVFCRLLRDLGLEITASRIIDVSRSLDVIDVKDRRSFYYALRANLVCSRRDIRIFDEVFELFWNQPEEFLEAESEPPLDDGCGAESPQQGATETLMDSDLNVEDWADGKSDDSDLDEGDIPGYSPNEVLAVKDFGAFSDNEIDQISQVINHLSRRIATKMSRRMRASRRGVRLDPRRTMRANIKYRGDIIRWVRKRRRIKKTKIVVLCDVSGSMDLYSRFLVQFLYAIQNRLTGVESLVFSTRLTRVTHILRNRSFKDALLRIGRITLDWSGGTNIGHCLYLFNRLHARQMIGPRSLVIIMSDGWDRGDSKLLEVEVQRLRQSAKKIIWLNPLLGSPNYRPICRGMSTCLPYVDHFLPVHNLQSLRQLGKTLHQLVRR